MPRGPSFFMKRYDRTKFAKPGKAFAVGTAVLGDRLELQGGAAGHQGLPGVPQPVARGREDRRARPEGSPGVHRLLPLAAGELRGELPRPAGGAQAEDLRLDAADAAGDDVRGDRRDDPDSRDDARPEGAGRAGRLRDPAQGRLERRVVRDGPEARRRTRTPHSSWPTTSSRRRARRSCTRATARS